MLMATPFHVLYVWTLTAIRFRAAHVLLTLMAIPSHVRQDRWMQTATLSHAHLALMLTASQFRAAHVL